MQMAQTAILLAAAVFAGLWAAQEIGLGVPIVDALLSGQRVAQRNLTRLVPAVALGLAVGLVITVLDRKVFPPLAAGLGNVIPEPAAWKGLLASFYGAIDEELLLRLGFLSLIALVLRRVARLFGATGDVLLPSMFWAANILAALVFGLGHLPATAAIAPLTPVIVARALILNGIAGIVCGWLYWQSGLEAAMFAHFTADLVLHVVSPLLR
jgi:hypothetical protein